MATEDFDVQEHLPLTARLSLAAGRDLIFGPRWSCSAAVVVFDRNSGDHWIVSLLAADVLSSMSAARAGSLASIAKSVPAAGSYYDPFAATTMVVENLVGYDLIQVG